MADRILTEDGRWINVVPTKKPVVTKQEVLAIDKEESTQDGSVKKEEVSISEDMTIKELKIIADSKGIKYAKGIKKAELLELLQPVDL